ncbi:hypothetical protein [Streptomyces botrytidirepellens]|uniref:Tetratricopeptide repeat protein n=1 Tax=Streptomyces botrytidirepellens TaxID=2486417 RepID=A0A3M8UAG3_9ACTN|nr:hypothetical protein [Streptomyces botrytidirepellens]RNG02449.1 hypothetical protein EEJ42_35110 [Streptomyces botrytidirepellens]
MDSDNPVVRLCVEGMAAEAEGRVDDARTRFRQAWDAATDDYEMCVAAHYLARHQPTPEETLRWNQECLDRADAVGDDRVRGFYASLHVNMGGAYRALGDPAAARRHFVRAAAHIGDVPPGSYADWTRFGIADGLRTARRDGPLAALLDRLCARGELRALGVILPPYLGDLGTEEDRERLVTALRMVHAARWLAGEEQEALSAVIGRE